MRNLGSLLVIVIAFFVAAGATAGSPLSEPIVPLPLGPPAADPDVVALGSKLFRDVRLSKSNTISCASCHNLQSGGADDKAFSIGVRGAFGTINAPTVFNSGYNFRQFWDGRAASLEDQIDEPVEHPKEMGSQWRDVVAKIALDASYVRDFGRLFKGGITKENIKSAIATFERSLVTSNSRFDQFLRGDANALTIEEKRGYQNFKAYGCIACHQGTNVGGNMFQTMGVMGRYFVDRGSPIAAADFGRFNVTKDEQDKFVFRVPSLRNVELTAPYFHDGSAKKLNDAVIAMAKYQLGRKLSNVEVNGLVAFLKTLTGERPESVKTLERNAASK